MRRVKVALMVAAMVMLVLAVTAPAMANVNGFHNNNRCFANNNTAFNGNRCFNNNTTGVNGTFNNLGNFSSCDIVPGVFFPCFNLNTTTNNPNTTNNPTINNPNTTNNTTNGVRQTTG